MKGTDLEGHPLKSKLKILGIKGEVPKTEVLRIRPGSRAFRKKTFRSENETFQKLLGKLSPSEGNPL